MSEKLDPTSELTDEEVEERQRAGARRTALLLGLLILVIAGIAFYYLWGLRGADLTDEETINVLLVGIADHELNENVEALVLTSVNRQAATVEAVALPVNTVLPWTAAVPAAARVAQLPDRTAQADEEPAATGRTYGDQLRDVYAGGDKAALTAAVERLVGAPVHHTVRVDFSGFVELINLLDGVPIDVETEVVYRDVQGNVVFRLEPGWQRLTGREALLYVRYKGDHLEDDSRRVARQWRFVEAVLTEARAKLGWPQVQQLLGIAFDHVSTDLDLAAGTRLLQTVFDMERDGYAMHMLPGTTVDGQWLVDADAVAALSGQLFYNPSWEAAQP